MLWRVTKLLSNSKNLGNTHQVVNSWQHMWTVMLFLAVPAWLESHASGVHLGNSHMYNVNATKRLNEVLRTRCG
eukprot:1386193-Amphidinium_carterae.1